MCQQLQFYQMGCTINRHCEILILVGSARAHSSNLGLVTQLQQFLIDKDVILKLVEPDLSKLPIFSTDIEHQIFLPKEIKYLREKAESADAIIFVTPQINGSVSPLILNAFVWLSRSYSERGSPLKNKKAGVMSASYLSENQIIDCIEMGKQLGMNFFKSSFYLFLGNKVVDQFGNLTSSYEKGRLQKWYKQFLAFVQSKE